MSNAQQQLLVWWAQNRPTLVALSLDGLSTEEVRFNCEPIVVTLWEGHADCPHVTIETMFADPSHVTLVLSHAQLVTTLRQVLTEFSEFFTCSEPVC